MYRVFKQEVKNQKSTINPKDLVYELCLPTVEETTPEEDVFLTPSCILYSITCHHLSLFVWDIIIKGFLLKTSSQGLRYYLSILHYVILVYMSSLEVSYQGTLKLYALLTLMYM